MKTTYRHNENTRQWLSIIGNVFVGGAYLGLLISLVYFLGSLTEGL